MHGQWNGRSPVPANPKAAAGDPPAVKFAEAAERCEELRARAMAGQPDGFRLGLGVLVRGGVAAWMQACSSVRGGTTPPIRAEPTSPGGGRADEVVAVLAAMAIACSGG